MADFAGEYKRLNDSQRQAVDNIDGPMLVIAGPGTGKTQLLSMRVANIIQQTDIAPSNILCLTFTDNAARNMRERLESIIGQSAYHVSIHTFHSFGVDVINQNPDFFTDRQLLQQVDELGSYELLKAIFEDLPHENPLSPKIGDEYVMLRDCLAVIGWLKQNALTPSEFRQILKSNSKFINKLADNIAITFEPKVSTKEIKKYLSLLQAVQDYNDNQFLFGFASYAAECALELATAIEATSSDSHYAPAITKWRNKWCVKDSTGKFNFKDSGRNLIKLKAVADVYEQLLVSMGRQGLYDFDDMIVEAVHALETNYELRANLQERYQYILVDEFQDTNKAQLRMLTALGDNPIFEGRPNIMVVGDDDQAIYAFQGAEVSNMVAFVKSYKDPEIISLRQNYRSTADILTASSQVAAQISDRLTSLLPIETKLLSAESKTKDGMVKHEVLPSELAQYDWLSKQIIKYINHGTAPEEIAVLAPKHKYLERLVPYLAKQHVPVAYERRENILDSPIIVQLLTMAKLVVAIAESKHDQIDALLAEVISYDFWDVSSEELLAISLECFNKNQSWLLCLSKHKNSKLNDVAQWFIGLARQSTTEPLEYILDSLMGVLPEGTDSEYDDEPIKTTKPKFVSPMRQHYFGKGRYEQATDSYLAVLGQLSTLRQRLRGWKPHKTLYVKDLIEFADLHRQANIKIIDTNPHTQTTKAVQVMTAYKAKGLEFEVVFVVNAQDEVWGPTARQRSFRIKLPANLPLAPTGNSDDDKLRLLFVALTRSKRDLIITSYSHDLTNRLSPGLSFIGGNTQESEPIDKLFKPSFIDKPVSAQAVEILSTDWAYRFRHIIADKPTLFEAVLNNYKLSVTHLNNFLDVASSGPNYFFIHNLLQFPEALTPAAAYGDSVHRTLHWFHGEFKKRGKPPTEKQIQDFFIDSLSRKHLRQPDYKRLEKRGRQALANYFKAKTSTWRTDDLIERGFNNEGAVVSEARLSGKIDKISFVEPGLAELVDFKTGKPSTSWQGKDEFEKIKLHKYKQQLLFYKLLVESSASFAKKLKVGRTGLEFIEADENGKLVDILSYSFNDQESERFIKLVGKVWEHIMNLQMPDISGYPKTLKGIEAFEQDLIEGKI